jgi:hypothetical protein
MRRGIRHGFIELHNNARKAVMNPSRFTSVEPPKMPDCSRPGLVEAEAALCATFRARRIQALAKKLLPCLPAQEWQDLFQATAPDAIRFEQKQQTLLYVEVATTRQMSQLDRDSFTAEVEWLAMRRGGVLDPFVDGAAAIFFDDPQACVRTAMELQRSAAELRLRMGIQTGICVIASFRTASGSNRSLVGQEIELAAQVAATAASGSIALSPETYALVKDELQEDATGCVVTEEFHDSDLAQVCLTPTPVKSEHMLSTFAGLGQF